MTSKSKEKRDREEDDEIVKERKSSKKSKKLKESSEMGTVDADKVFPISEEDNKKKMKDKKLKSDIKRKLDEKSKSEKAMSEDESKSEKKKKKDKKLKSDSKGKSEKKVKSEAAMSEEESEPEKRKKKDKKLKSDKKAKSEKATSEDESEPEKKKKKSKKLKSDKKVKSEKATSEEDSEPEKKKKKDKKLKSEKKKDSKTPSHEIQMVSSISHCDSRDIFIIEPSQDKSGVTLLLFYQYVEPVWSIARHKEVMKFVEARGAFHELGGRMRCSREGLNCTITGPFDGVRGWCNDLRGFDPAFTDTEFKLTDHLPTGQHFPKLNAFPVEELVNYGLAGEKAPPISETGTHLEPADYHKKIGEKDTVIIDIRNYYESSIGHFQPPPEGAELLDPRMRKSTEFPVWLDKPEIKEKLRGRQVLMYCTGGVRCERASALLRQKMQTVDADLGIKGVYQLQGGIHKYIENYPEGGFWAGKNYTFDKRFAHAPVSKEHEATEEIMGKCEGCRKPWDKFRGKRRCPTCGVPSLICKDCVDKDSSGEKKLGKDVKCELCVQECITHKSQIRDRDRKEMEEYQRRQRKLQKEYGSAPIPLKAVPEVNIAIEDITAGITTPAPNYEGITRLWIGSLKTDVMTVESLSKAIPNIKFVQWMTDIQSGSFKGFCFAEMMTPQDAGVAVAASGKKILGKNVKIIFQKPNAKCPWPPPNAIYISEE